MKGLEGGVPQMGGGAVGALPTSGIEGGIAGGSIGTEGIGSISTPDAGKIDAPDLKVAADLEPMLTVTQN